MATLEKVIAFCERLAESVLLVFVWCAVVVICAIVILVPGFFAFAIGTTAKIPWAPAPYLMAAGTSMFTLALLLGYIGTGDDSKDWPKWARKVCFGCKRFVRCCAHAYCALMVVATAVSFVPMLGLLGHWFGSVLGFYPWLFAVIAGTFGLALGLGSLSAAYRTWVTQFVDQNQSQSEN